MSPRAAVLLTGLILLAGAARAGEGDARAIIDKYAQTLPADEQVEMRLDIYRRVGVGQVDLSRPQLTVRLKRGVRGRGAAARVRIDVLKPASMAGIALTAEWDAKRGKYKVLRFLPGTSALSPMAYLRTSFMQSHLIYEDVVPLVVDNYSYKAKGEKKVGGADCWVVEATPKRPSAYVKRVYCIRKSDHRAAKVEYYSRGYRGPELKLTRILKDKNTEEWVTAKTGEKTVVTYAGRKNEAPPEERFKPASLKSNPSLLQLMRERAKLLQEEEELTREIKKLREERAKLKAGKK